MSALRITQTHPVDSPLFAHGQFASKVMGHLRFGFAAGVGFAAGLCPAVEVAFPLLGYALRAASGPINLKGGARTRGIARNNLAGFGGA
jgi:hypothetical protein